MFYFTARVKCLRVVPGRGREATGLYFLGVELGALGGVVSWGDKDSS